MHAIDVMSRNVVTVTPLHSVVHAAETMIDREVSGLPVLDDDGRLVGIVTEGDLLRRTELGIGFAGERPCGSDPKVIAELYVKSHAWNVGAVMTRDVTTAEEDTQLSVIAERMMDGGFKRLPIVRGRRIVGIVSRADLLKCIVRARRPSTVESDEGIALSILAHTFADLMIEPKDFDVEVDHGHVVLKGRIASESMRKAIVTTADCIQGVTAVEDRLEIGEGARP